ncbi:MAG: molybdenum cofactor guanylyltransferase [Clostridia bacterium]|nr:molybdenum cofactor guanylyltransferase [Clostridia bacterium]
MAKIGFLLLSGGQSRRMGTHKALLEVRDGTLLDVIAKAGAGFEERILSANDPAIPTPEGFARCADVYPGCGPMAGIHAALSLTACDALVTAPCDAPNYAAELALYLASQYDPAYDALILVDETGRAQPLTGVYGKSCLPVLEAHLGQGKYKMMQMLEGMRLGKLTLPAHLSQHVFDNLNTPQELQQYKKTFE